MVGKLGGICRGFEDRARARRQPLVPGRKRFPGASRGGAENAEMEHPIGFVPSCETIGGAVRAELGLGVPKGDKTLMTIGTLGTIGT
jgi:hypothetical protein